MSEGTTEQRPARANKALPGPTKAALWLLSIDEDVAIDVLNELEEVEVKTIARSIESLGHTTSEELQSIHMEFANILEREPLFLRGSTDYLGKLASKAFGENRARVLLHPAAEPLPEPDPAEALKQADVEVLISLLEQQHPQIIAAVLASLDSGRSGQLLKMLPEEISRGVIERVARLKRVPRAALAQAERVLAAGLPVSLDDDLDMDGVRVAAGLLNQLDSDTADEILDSFSDEDDVADSIRQAMFTFEDLATLDRRGIQALLKEVQSDQLLLAMKTASDELKELIFSSVSKRAADMLRDDLEVMGPARLSDVEGAQQDIVAVALQMQTEGKISIAGRGGDDFV